VKRLLSIHTIEVLFAGYDEILTVIDSALHRSIVPQTIGYINAHTVNLCARDPFLQEALRRQTINYAEGVGIHLAAWFLHTSTTGLRLNHNATDLNERLLGFLNSEKRSIYFLGGTPSTMDSLLTTVRQRYPDLRIAGACDGYSGMTDPALIEGINGSQADVVMLALGQPNQERWLYLHRDMINVPVCIAAGGFFDFISGTTLRAPWFVRAVRMEWFFRMMMEPGRLWKRYIIGIPQFIFLILKQRMQR
jgi:N-acetylglucosaminyldiphosphoundecaprenol N-acetyl-beta-D-mannosaminyltransferase